MGRHAHIEKLGQTEDEPASKPSGACTAADMTKWRGNGRAEFDADMHDCATLCLGGDVCVASCIQKRGYSAGCSPCFGAVSACTVSQCLFKCIRDVGCRECAFEQCRPGF